jgi:RNA polymerase sigma factor (sigma-70 family)
MTLDLRRLAKKVGARAGYLLDADDLTQEAEIALLLAARSGRIPSDPKHAEKYRYTRARGAMIDAARQMHGHFENSYQFMSASVDDEAGFRGHEDAHTQTPDRRMQIRAAVAHLYKVSKPKQRQYFAMMLSGTTEGEAAAVLGVSHARVWQYRQAARIQLERHWS